jgi:glyoxylase-like metal-dependent hydrolase (beta-lactamase superfamily II)
MMTLNRRAMLTGAVAASAATALTPFASEPALAAAPPVGTQAPGWYRYKVGTHEITVVTDGVNRFRFPDGFVTNKTRDEVNAAVASLYPGLEKDQFAIPYSPIAVNTGSKLVVIDSGTGEANFERSKGASGQFHRNLKAAGIDRNQVDVVIISHFHGDHINGLIGPDNKPAFPNAEIMVPAVEMKYFMDDGEMNKQTSERMKGVFAGARKVFDALGRKVTQYEAGKEIAPGITSIATFGHTPGHMSYVVASGNSKVYVQSDVTNTPVFVRNPDWHAFFDQDANMAEATRRKFYDQVSSEKALLQGFHYPFPALAYIEKSGSGYREVPVPWSPTI